MSKYEKKGGKEGKLLFTVASRSPCHFVAAGAIEVYCVTNKKNNTECQELIAGRNNDHPFCSTCAIKLGVLDTLAIAYSECDLRHCFSVF